MAASYAPVHVGDIVPSNYHSNRGHEHKFWSAYRTAHTFELFSSVVALASINGNESGTGAALFHEDGTRRTESTASTSDASDVLLASSGGSLQVYSLQKMKLIRSLSKGKFT